jgi:hypothetical protein
MTPALLEGIERDAVLAEWRAAPDELRSRLILGWSQVDGALVTRLERMDNGWFNRVIGLGMEKPARRDVVAQMVAGFRATGSKQFSVQVAPGAQPAELSSWLKGLGLEPTSRVAKLVRPPGPIPAPACQLQVAPVELRDAAAFGKVSCAGWGLPAPLAGWMASLVGRERLRAYLAWDAGEPVAAAILYFGDDNLAWVGGAATLPSHRGRGAQSALIARRIADAKDYTLVAETQEDDASFRNCLKSGFHRAYVRESFTQTASR